MINTTGGQLVFPSKVWNAPACHPMRVGGLRNAPKDSLLGTKRLFRSGISESLIFFASPDSLEGNGTHASLEVIRSLQ